MTVPLYLTGMATYEATVANCKVWYLWQLSEETTATDGQTLKLTAARTKLQEIRA